MSGALRSVSGVFLAGLLVQMGLASQAGAQVQDPNNVFMLNGSFRSGNGTSITYAGGHSITELDADAFYIPVNGDVEAPAPSSGTATSFFDIFVDVNIDGSFYQANGRGTATITSTGGNTFNTQLTQLDVSGGTLPSGVELRIDPTTPSTGQTTFVPSGGGFQVTSFFDIFTDLSLDGGHTFLPPSAPVVDSLTGLPEPSSLGLIAIAGLTMLRRPAAKRR